MGFTKTVCLWLSVFLGFCFQVLDFSNWDENERVCEVQRISIQPLHCVENNVTSCGNHSDNFNLFYHDENITLSLQDTNRSVLEEKLNDLSAFEGLGQINVTTINSTDGNVTVFLVWFCFADPRGVEVLNGTAHNSQSLSLNITRLVEGRSAEDFQLIVGDETSDVLKPSSSKRMIEDVLTDFFSKQCYESSLSKCLSICLFVCLSVCLICCWSALYFLDITHLLIIKFPIKLPLRFVSICLPSCLYVYLPAYLSFGLTNCL